MGAQGVKEENGPKEMVENHHDRCHREVPPNRPDFTD